MKHTSLKVGDSVVFNAKDGASYSAKVAEITRFKVILSIPSLGQRMMIEKSTAAKCCVPFGNNLFLAI